jgi:uncharacterized protein (DUF1330 family)
MKLSRRIFIFSVIFVSGFVLGVLLTEFAARRRVAAVYMVAELRIKDREKYGQYVERVYDIVRRHGGRYLIRGGRVTPMFGDWAPERMIVIVFDSLEALKECFASPEYLAVAPLREASAETRAVILEGYRP